MPIYFFSSLLLLLISFPIFSVNYITWHRNKIFNCIAPYLPKKPFIVDCGTYNAKDAIAMSNRWPSAEIFAFECDPRMQRIALANIGSNKHIHLCCKALSNINGKSIFYQSFDPDHPGNFQSGSLLKPKEHLNYSNVTFPSTVEVETITLDTWAQQNNINHIDFLWLDMQGMELHMLKASPKILKTVRIIYMEVEFVEAYEGQYTYNESQGWLESQGFSLIAKDFTDIDNKKRWYGNIVMVRK